MIEKLKISDKVSWVRGEEIYGNFKDNIVFAEKINELVEAVNRIENFLKGKDTLG